jgi:hypothetical protein
MKTIAIILFVLIATAVQAQDDEPDLRLKEVESFQVSGGVIAPPGSRLSLEVLKAPFVDMLQRKGKTVDQNNYDNVISTDVEIAASGSMFTVDIHFEYRESCVMERLKLHTTCAVWEHYKLLKVFSSLDEADNYVITTIKAAAQLFGAEFDRR